MTYERKGLILSYRGRSKLGLKTLLGIHLFEKGKDEWNLSRQPNTITVKNIENMKCTVQLITFTFNVHNGRKNNLNRIE